LFAWICNASCGLIHPDASGGFQGLPAGAGTSKLNQTKKGEKIRKASEEKGDGVE
jgi:hypothetical protein